MNTDHIIIIVALIILVLVVTAVASHYMRGFGRVLLELSEMTASRNAWRKSALELVQQRTALTQALDQGPKPLNFSVFAATVDSTGGLDGGMIDLLTCTGCKEFDVTTEFDHHLRKRLCRDCINANTLELLYEEQRYTD